GDGDRAAGRDHHGGAGVDQHVVIRRAANPYTGLNLKDTLDDEFQHLGHGGGVGGGGGGLVDEQVVETDTTGAAHHLSRLRPGHLRRAGLRVQRALVSVVDDVPVHRQARLG